jgi:hypothetical protein
MSRKRYKVDIGCLHAVGKGEVQPHCRPLAFQYSVSMLMIAFPVAPAPRLECFVGHGHGSHSMLSTLLSTGISTTTTTSICTASGSGLSGIPAAAAGHRHDASVSVQPVSEARLGIGGSRYELLFSWPAVG